MVCFLLNCVKVSIASLAETFKTESKDERTSWAKIAEFVCKRGKRRDSHRSQSEIRQSDPYSASPEHRTGPSAPIIHDYGFKPYKSHSQPPTEIISGGQN